MYSIPAQNSKFSILINRLNQLARTFDFTSFDLIRIKKEAEDVKNNVDLASGFALLGMIACLEKDEEEVRSLFKRAIEQSCRESWHIANFAISLKSLGLMEDAYEHAREAYERASGVVDHLNLVIELACVLNKKADFEEFTKVWHKINKEMHPLEVAPFYREVDTKEYSSFLNKHVPEIGLRSGHLDPVAILAECGPAIIRIFGAPLNVVTEVMMDPGLNPNLVAWIQWFGDMEEGMELYDQFEQWYVENDYDLKTDIVSFNIEFVGS